MDNPEFSIPEVFESAVNIVRNLPKEGPIKPSDELKLKLYAYYKQATHGQNDTPKPRFYQIVEAYKWDAWKKLGEMTKEDAMLNYISELKQIMDIIPKEDADLEESKRFEDILGKKFYDYWFNQWQQDEQSCSNRDLISSSGSGGVAREQASKFSVSRGNDAQSNSSSGSSMSMLEDTQSATGDGYKTPTSVTHNIASQMNDQVALSIIRLHQGLDETRKRLDHVEDQLKTSIGIIKRLENQTLAKQLAPADNSSGCVRGAKHGRNSSSACLRLASRLINLMAGKNSFHLFYLTYPILIYILMRAFDKRREKSALR